MQLMRSVGHIQLIARNTFLEAVRQKFFNTLLLISVALVGSATFFQQFDFGVGELKFITDFGFGVLLFFGSILSITATTQLFFNEIENRTALNLLAKPVYKLEFLTGKFFGVFGLMLVFTVFTTLAIAGVLYWRETLLMAHFAEAFPDGRSIRYIDLVAFGLLQWIKFGILNAITLFIASFSNTSLYTITVSFFVLVVCHLQYIARDAYASIESLSAQWLVRLLSLIFPNFQLFNIGDRLVFDSKNLLTSNVLFSIAVYGMTYICAFILLAQANFKKREL